MKIDSPSAVTPLIAASLRDKQVREAIQKNCSIIAWISDVGGEQAIEPLMKALGDKEEEVREIAALTLIRLGDPDTLARLLSILTRKQYNSSQVTDGAIAALEHKQALVRVVAVEILGKIGDSQAVEYLLNVLSNAVASRLWSRSLAPVCRILGEFRCERAVPLLEKALFRPDAAQAAATALVKIGGTRSVSFLSMYLSKKYCIKKFGEEQYLPCRQLAINTLGMLGKPAVPRLVNALKSEEYSVRRGAAEALGLIGDIDGVTPLIENFLENITFVRTLQESATVELKALLKVLLKILTANKDASTTSALIASLKDATERLDIALTGEDWEIRRRATWILGLLAVFLNKEAEISDWEKLLSQTYPPIW